ncbi:MAG: DUF2061 domain-containing protein [Limisphaerales bacterium]
MSEPKQELRESHLRSLLKGITWRCLATFVTFLLAHLITGEIDKAAKIAMWEFLAKLFVYYGHERIWQLVPRGRVRKLISSESKS